MIQSPEIDQVSAAVVTAISELKNITMSGKNPFFKSDYATLEDTITEFRPVLKKHGLALIQLPTVIDGKPGIETTLLHSSGQHIGGETIMELQKQDPQGFGSAWTYYRRYTAQAILGITTDGSDDDDEHATAPTRNQQSRSIPARGNNNGPSEPQLRRIYAIAKQSGYTEANQKDVLVENFGYHGSRTEMPWDMYEKFTKYMEANPIEGDQFGGFTN